MGNLPKKDYAVTDILNAFFDLKTVVYQKSKNLGMISARHTTNRQSFKKVTCPFKHAIFRVLHMLGARH